MATIRRLPLDPDARATFARAAKEQFEEACLRMDWRDAVKARANWDVDTFIDRILLAGLAFPISHEQLFDLLSERLNYHITMDLILPEGASIH